jgi:hypothetical protein
MASMKAPPILEASADCEDAFRECLMNPDLLLFEDQLSRFRLWAANIEVFSASRASLDNRLRNSEGTRDMILQLLHSLQMNLRYCKHLFIIRDTDCYAK